MGCLQSGFNPQKYAVRDSGESFDSGQSSLRKDQTAFDQWEIAQLNDKNTQNIYIENDGKINKGMRINPNAFHFLKVLGKGAFGKVLLVEKRDTNQLYAMKVIRKDSLLRRNQRVHTKEERRIMENLTSSFIVQLYYAFQTTEKLYMVMDFMVGGELFFHLKKEGKFTEARTKFYAGEIVLALEYMHNKGIIYRDLKPENILMDAEGHIKIVDFGLSKQGVEGGLKTYTFCGTPEYLAPEILQGNGHDKAVDYWSLGAFIYEMLVGDPPFIDDDKQRMFKNMLEKPVELPQDITRDAASLLTGLLTINPAKRLSNPIDIKRHEFFKGIEWDKLAKRQIKPPYVPKLKNEKDLRYFDKEFTTESIGETPVFRADQTYSNDTFQGFTFDKDLKKSDKFGSKTEL